jgi:hypothetical protein
MEHLELISRGLLLLRSGPSFPAPPLGIRV